MRSWDICEVNTDETPIKGVMLRGRIRKFAIKNNLDLLTENASDTENTVRFAVHHGTGGTLLRPKLLGIGYDPGFEDKGVLSKNLRATVLHECYHAVQGWSDENPTMVPTTLLEDGVLEGVATVFEREYGKTTPPWSVYKDDETMHGWLSLVKQQNNDPNSRKYFDYKFGEVKGEKWMLYRLGTWIADKALDSNPGLSITSLASKEAKDIISLAGLTDI